MVNRRKNKSAKKTSRSKNVTKMSVNSLLNSVNMLYVVSLVAILNVLSLMMKQDNESVFLFIVIAMIVYVTNKNMIMVLGIPLIVVNLLIFIKSQFNMQVYEEGFIDESSYSELEFQKFIKQKYSNNNKVKEYTENLEDLTSLSELIENVLTNDDDDSDNFNKEPVTELVEFLTYVDGLEEEDDLYDNEQVKYGRSIITEYKNFDFSKLKQNNTAENNPLKNSSSSNSNNQENFVSKHDIKKLINELGNSLK